MALIDLAARLARLLPPETAHEATIAALAAAPPALLPKPAPDAAILRTELAGLALSNPVGLAAGFDKGARAPDAALRLGFGFVECGTVTPQPQPGNPRPRLFRLVPDRAVINRMGFNSEGLTPALARLAARKGRGGVVGLNLGANKDAPDRIADYVEGLARLAGRADYLTINISSPNTPGLRALQTKASLEELLGRLGEADAALAPGRRRPLFLKLAPDLEPGEIETIAQTCAASGLIAALIVSNTTLARPPSLKSRHARETGGLSGRPLFAPSTRALAQFRAVLGGRLALIGAGGVEDGATAYAKIRAGASAVQLYTALVYEGPGLVARIKADLAARLAADGFASVAEAVGVDGPA